MNINPTTSPFQYASAEGLHTANYLTGPILAECRRIAPTSILDVGCGNGAMCGVLAAAGFRVEGCDPSEEGIHFARLAHPSVSFHLSDLYDESTGFEEASFDTVISTEVIEHLFAPRALPRFAAKVLRPGGHLVLSTPYHGYLKNLALAAAGRLDGHFTASWDGGHIKFWSCKTLSKLLADEGFTVRRFIGAGRFPGFWKSMILVAQKN